MTSRGERAANVARLWLGTPYRHQASILGAGCDCLGLLRGVWREIVGCEPAALPVYPADPRRDAEPGALRDAANKLLIEACGQSRPGQVILFQLNRQKPPRHCGIVSRPGWFIHAQERLGVIEAPLTPPWQRRVFATYDFPEPS